MSTTPTPSMQQVPSSGSNPEVPVNENFLSLDWAAVYGFDPDTSTGLTWGYLGGRWGGFAVTKGTLALTASGSPDTFNYMVVERATGTPTMSTDVTNWNNVAAYARVYKIRTSGSTVDYIEDHRAGPYGVAVGSARPIAWNAQSGASYTLALTDAENAVEMSNAAANTITIPANSTVAFPVGTSILIYQAGLGITTIAPAGGVTLRAKSIGSPTATALTGQFALATLVKRATDTWILAGDIQ